MRRSLYRIPVLGLLVALVTLPARGDDFFFKDGDRVVMMGDSITEQHLYSNYVEMWTLTRFPGWNLTFRNVGIGGDRSIGGNSRFKRDTEPYRPTAMTVDFGMNDGGYRSFDEKTFRTYMGGLEGIARQARATGIRVAWVTPQPLDTDLQGSTALTDYNQTLERFSAGVGTIAKEEEGRFVDQFHPYLAVLDKARSAGPKYDRITGGDAVHPGSPGQALMAAAILQGLGFPNTVSSVEIVLDDGPPRERKARTRNCRVTFPDGSTSAAATGAKEDRVTFERTDAALPFFPDEARPILKSAPILEELNQYTLSVIGLKPGKYSIRLGGAAVAEHRSDELAWGVNLADAALKIGPIADQVKAVKAAVEAKNRYHHDQIFRGIVLAPVNIPDWLGIKFSKAEIDARRQAVIAERMARLAELDDQVRKTLQIRPHTVEIVRIGD